MTRLRVLCLVLLLIVTVGYSQEEKQIAWENFGKLPIDDVRIFAPETISTDDFEFAITFSPEMDELCFTRRKQGEKNNIYCMKYENDKWSNPYLASFSNSYMDFEPHISPNGKRLYFGSLRPVDGKSGLHQWYLEKINNQWSKPKVLDASFIGDKMLMYLTSTKDETIYFTIIRFGSESGIFYSKKNQENYSSAVRLGETVNQVDSIVVAHPFVAPDESYLIYDFEGTNGFGSCDLYISFKQDDGTWSESINLGNSINTEFCEMCASVSPDGKFLFFHRGNDTDIGNIYWIDFNKILSNLKAN